MSAHDALEVYLLSCPSMYSALGCIDVSGLIRCLFSSTNTRRLSLVTRASSKDRQNSKVEPLRITSNVKLNLRFLKRAREKKAGSRPSTGFRRKKSEKTQDGEEAERTSIYDSDSDFEEVRPVLLVDGYNMCGYWSKLKKHFKRGDLQHARQLLLEELVRFSAIKEIKVVVVFDASASGLEDHKETYQGLDVIYSASRSADTWIEREVGLLKDDGCPKIWVATSDLMQQQCANASGAFVWSCRLLLAAIKDAKKEREEMLLETKSYSMKGKLLEDNLDPDVCHTLKMLKKELEKSKPS